MKESKKVKIEFYADTFRHCVIDVPASIEPRTENAELFIENELDYALRSIGKYPKKGQWRVARGSYFYPNQQIRIITAKYV